ncbi:MAG: LysM peptidoglycan-binding domain-containing protein [Kiritimatiellae bacterium]|nr:LysM peptidoglycan-binding domain-containing protein [Kiritimatiellia bacterium]
MSLARGRFGIEYNPRPRKENPSGAGCLVAIVTVVAAISLAIHTFRRHKATADDPQSVQTAQAETQTTPRATTAAETTPTPPPPPPAPVETPEEHVRILQHRQPSVKNRLLRLEEAEKAGNVPLAVSTIEELRSLPGQPAADLDDTLARRVGDLNAHWLFDLGNLQWVEEVAVRPGESATRIARSHGSTLASLVRLNNLTDANHIRPGQRLKVMNHPKTTLAVHKRAGYADLYLNEKFFRRYDLTGDVTGDNGLYPLENDNSRALIKKLGLAFSTRDKIEIEMLLPKGANITISER